MKLIIGLGNPGEKYLRTRHNLGFVAVEHFMQDLEPIKKTVWDDNKKCKSNIVEIDWQPKHGQAEHVILAKPKTFMNNSGMAVGLLAKYFKIKPEDIWVLHDDIDLQVGALRIRSGGSAAGHRGIESIMQSMGTDKFWRFRMGIGHPKKTSEDDHKHLTRDVDDFVLGTFIHSERGKVRELVKHTSKALAAALEDGLEASMNRYNTK